MKLRAGEELLRTIVIKPPLARLETRDYRVTRSGVMFRCMLIWRTIAAANVTALGASAKMKPPSSRSQALYATCSAWLGRRVDTIPLGLHAPSEVYAVATDAFMGSCRSAVSDARIALPDFYNVTVRIANIAARFAVFGLWLRDELGSSTSP